MNSLINNIQKFETKYNSIKCNDTLTDYHDYIGIILRMQRWFTIAKSSCNSNIKRKRGRKSYSNLNRCRKVTS